MRKKIKLIYIMWFSVSLGQFEAGQNLGGDSGWREPLDRHLH